MATLPTLTAASPLNANDGVRQTFAVDTSETRTFALADTPSDFASMDSLTWTADYREGGAGTIDDDVIRFEVRIMSGATVLAAANSGGTFVVVDSNVRNTTDVTRGPTAFGYVNTGASKALWDAAVVEARQNYTKNKSSDGVTLQVDYFAVNGVYTQAAVARSITGASTGLLSSASGVLDAVAGIAGASTAPLASASGTADTEAGIAGATTAPLSTASGTASLEAGIAGASVGLLSVASGTAGAASFGTTPVITTATLGPLAVGTPFAETLGRGARSDFTVQYENADGGSDTQPLSILVAPASGAVVWEANKPAGLTLEIDTQFPHPFPPVEVEGAEGWAYAGSEDNYEGQAEPGARYTGDCFQHVFAEGTTGDGTGNGTVYGGGGQHRQIYYCVEYWFDANYVMHHNTEKAIYPRTYRASDDAQITSNQILGWVAPKADFGTSSEAELASYVHLNRQLQTTLSPESAEIQFNVNKGEWFQVELYAQMNTAGNQDGICKVWINDVLAVDEAGLTYADDGSTPIDAYWSVAYLNATRGGGSALNPVPAGGQKRQYSRFSYHVSSTRAP